MKQFHLSTGIFASSDCFELPSPSVGDVLSNALVMPVMGSLERCVSNPLIRQLSNNSVASQEGGAHFVPFGRGHEEISNEGKMDIDHVSASPIPPQDHFQIPHIRTNPSMAFDATPPLRPDQSVYSHTASLDSYFNEGIEYKVPLQSINGNQPRINISPPQPPIAPSTPPMRSRFPFVAITNENMMVNANRFKRPTASKMTSKTTTCTQQKQRVISCKKSDVSTMSVAEIIDQKVSLQQLMKKSLVLKLIKHAAGSRYVQQKLHNAEDNTFHAVLRHIFQKGELLTCSKDIYGNYVMQIFFERNVTHQILINYLLRTHMMELSRHSFGCRIPQKAMDHVSKSAMIPLIKELNTPQISKLIEDQNSNHVIQKVLSLGLKYEHVKFIIDAVECDIFYYAKHIFGCRIVQCIVNYYGYVNDKALIKRHFVGKNKDDGVLELCKQKYSNYVIQDILKLSFGDDDCKFVKNDIIKTIYKNVWILSMNKFGSNVVEKCILNSNVNQIDFLLKQITKKNAKVLGKMMNDKFANYCVQKLLVTCTAKQQKRLIHAIELNVDGLEGMQFGKHIYHIMEKVKQIKHRLEAQERKRVDGN